MDPVDLIAAAKSDSLMDVDSVDASWLLDMVKMFRQGGRKFKPRDLGFKNTLRRGYCYGRLCNNGSGGVCVCVGGGLACTRRVLR